MCKRSSMRAATPEEKKALGIPPAYTNVRVAEDPSADLIATATINKRLPDGRIVPTGKTFYKYNPAFVAKQAAKKFARVQALAKKAEAIERRIERDCLNVAGDNYHLAMTARLILLTGLRNGNPPQGEKESFGASSLKLVHCTTDFDTLSLDFPGKHGVRQEHVVRDSILANYVRARIDADAIDLFPHGANETLRYLKKIGAAKVHDLRTLRANALASALVDEIVKQGVPDTKKGKKALIKFVATKVSEVLGNKPGQALKSYIDPKVIRRIEEA